jgi:C-terminal processing protease CtpA/Prc
MPSGSAQYSFRTDVLPLEDTMNLAKRHGMLLWKASLGCLFASVVIVVTSDAQAPIASAGPELSSILNFEVEQTGSMPRGWSGGPAGTISIDEGVVHSGRRSARLERNAESSETFSTITKAIPADFRGVSVEWRGFLRTEDVSEFTGLWLREDGEAGAVAFDNMQRRQIKGTHDWTEYSITLPLRSEARRIFFGILISGTGKVWADDLQLLVDGKPVWEAPKVEQVKTVVDTDHEFDAGSKIDLSSLTPVQTQNLEMLGRVWGFVKYHHPAVAAGKHHWDYELFRVMPKVLAANNRNAADTAVADWIRGLGDVSDCRSDCAQLSDKDLHFGPQLRWLNNDSVVGPDLAQLLRTIYRNRAKGSKFYISHAQGVGNPVFEHEPAYPNVRFPDPGYQLLALYRYSNIIQYWYPNRNVLDQDWNDVLREFIPKVALAKTKDAYRLEMIQLIGRITDTHANLNVPPQVLPPAGTCQLPVVTRFIENRAVVTGYSEPAAGPNTGIRVGDVIESLDDGPVQELVAQWMPYYPASNDVTRLRNIARSMTRGQCGPVRVGIRREDGRSTVSAERVPLGKLNLAIGFTHDRPGETFQLLADDVAYLKLSSIKAADVAGYINRAKDTKGLIIDIRNYPSEFVVFALGSLLVDQQTPFARFTAGDADDPGAFYWTAPVQLKPQSPHYAGKVVILADETSLSQAEYTTMAFRSVRGSIVVGSTTAGADGNVSPIPLPGGLNTLISGIGVFYPDKRPTQRIGIVPDVEVRPTIAGIRANRDEVLDEAIRRIRMQ